MILSAQSIRQLRPVTPFHERTVSAGMTYGVGPAGYDVRLQNALTLAPGEFALGSTVERFTMPDGVLGQVSDKSTWARRGLSLFNTVIEPGWRGWLTLELVNLSRDIIRIEAGSPIAQILFLSLDQATDTPYRGKYQDQPARPVEPILQHELPLRYSITSDDEGEKIYKGGVYVGYVNTDGWLHIIGANGYAKPIAECNSREDIPLLMDRHG